MTRAADPEAPQACLLHGDFHPLADACRAVAFDHLLRHAYPSSNAAWHDYQGLVEQALLDRHIREHRGLPQPDPIPYTYAPPTASGPWPDDMRRVA